MHFYTYTHYYDYYYYILTKFMPKKKILINSTNTAPGAHNEGREGRGDGTRYTYALK